jgi:hypothetical protein
LVLIGHIEILPHLYGRVLIPPAVWSVVPTSPLKARYTKMAVLIIKPSAVGLVILLIAISAAATYLITRQVLRAQGTWDNLKSRHRKLLRKVSSLKKEAARLGMANQKLLLEAQRLLTELSTERATRDSSIRAAVAEWILSWEFP